MTVQIWVDPAAPPALAQVALDAEIEAVLETGVALEDIWVVDAPTKWRIVDGP